MAQSPSHRFGQIIVKQYQKLPAKKQTGIANSLRSRYGGEIERFTSSLRLALTRRIESVYVLPLHGAPRTLADVAEAIAFIESKPDTPFTRYEVGVRYSNGDEVRGQFKDKTTAIVFLRGIR